MSQMITVLPKNSLAVLSHPTVLGFLGLKLAPRKLFASSFIFYGNKPRSRDSPTPSKTLRWPESVPRLLDPASELLGDKLTQPVVHTFTAIALSNNEN